MRRNQTKCGYIPRVASYYPVDEGIGSRRSNSSKSAHLPCQDCRVWRLRLHLALRNGV